MTERLSVNIGTPTAGQIRRYRGRTGVSVTETIRRAVHLLHLVSGREVVVRPRDGRMSYAFRVR